MILLVTGAESVRVRERVQEFVEHFVQKYDPQRLNVEFFREGTAFSLIRDQLLASPFLAEKRMVVLTGFLRDTSKAAMVEWQNLLMQLPASTIAVIAETDVDSLDFAWLTTMPDVHAYPLTVFTDSERQAWLQDRATRQGLRFTPGAWRFFLQAVGADITRADIEFAKLSAYASGAVLEEWAVRRLVAPMLADEGPFAFANALGGTRASVLLALRHERLRGVPDFLLFGTLLRTARLQGQIKAILQQPIGDAPKELGMHPFVFKKESAALGKQTLPMLISRLQRGAALDRAIKRGLPPEIGVDRYLADFLA